MASWANFSYQSVDAHVSNAFLGLVKASAGVELTSSPLTKGLPTVDSPTPVILGMSLYITLVLSGLGWIRAGRLKPRVREPLILQALVLFHNLFCLSLSLYMCLGIICRAYQLKYHLWGNSYDPSESKMAHYIYIFYMSKFVEFVDTVVMLLKRNVRQVTLLHVYHHMSVALIWWTICHYAPGGDAYFSAAFNSCVHVLMYLYYFLSAILRNDDKTRRKYLFWGKYLTQFQMLQFVCNLIQASYCIRVRAPYPQFLYKLLFYYMISLLLLFANFYVRKYVMGSKVKQK